MVRRCDTAADGRAGTWRTYDRSGAIVKETSFGN
jgi:hypothetical protein